MNVSSQQNTVPPAPPKECQTYFDLIVKVGSDGKYQYLLSFIFLLVWYVTGALLLSTSFIYLNPTFDCAAFGLLTDTCYDFVCALPRDQWPNFVTEEANNFKSIANSFDNYFCDDQVYLNIYASCTYFGALLGYAFVTFLSDNFGRRKVSILAWGLSSVGLLILYFAQNIQMAATGLFLCGFGSDSVLNVTFSIMVECYEDRLRQRHCTIIQIFFTSGALIITLLFWLWSDWKIVVMFALLIPSIITLALMIVFMKESPMFIVKENPQVALKELNEIGKFNNKGSECLVMKDIEDVMRNQDTVAYDKVSTPLDVFRYESLRTTTIAQGIASICTYLLYYGPALIVAQIGFDIYTSQVVVSVSDFIVYYPLMLVIDRVKRKKTCIILLSIATVICITLIFLVKPDKCDMCFVVFFQLGLVFIFRSCVSAEFTCMLVYQSQAYPTRVRNIAAGVLGVFGTIASTIAPIIMGALTRAEINSFILFTCLGILGIASFTFGPETFQKTCPQEIAEIEFQKKNKSLRHSKVFDDKLHTY